MIEWTQLDVVAVIRTRNVKRAAPANDSNVMVPLISSSPLNSVRQESGILLLFPESIKLVIKPAAAEISGTPVPDASSSAADNSRPHHLS